MIINELLIPENFIKAKKRLEDSPEHQLFFENKGFTKSEIFNSNIGLTEEGKLYTPILFRNMVSCGVFFITPSLSLGTYEVIDSGVNGFIGSINTKESKTLVIVQTISELLFVRYRTDYTNVILIPAGVHPSFFVGIDHIILLHYDLDLITAIGRDVNCFYLEHEYIGDKLGIPEVVSIRDTTNFYQNPFIINDELYINVYNGRNYVTTYDKMYECKRIENGLVFNHEIGEVYINTNAVQIKATRFDVTTEEAFNAAYEYIKDLNVYFSPQDAETIAYFVLYTWVFPHFGNNIFNLNVYFVNGNIIRLAINSLKWIMPGANLSSFSLPSIYFRQKDSAYTVPGLGLFKTSYSDMYTEGMPLIITSETPYRKAKFEHQMGIKTKTILFNWALGFKKGNQIRIKEKQTPYLDPLGYIVLKEEDLGRVRSSIEKSSILLQKIQKSKDFEHDVIIF